MPFIENYNEFKQRQNCKEEPINIQGVLTFENGAAWSNMAGANPPEDEYELARIQSRYYRAKLKLAEDEFFRYQSHSLNQASLAARYANLPGADPNAPVILKKLKAEATMWGEKLQASIDILKNSPANQLKRKREELMAERRAEHQELINKIKQI